MRILVGVVSLFLAGGIMGSVFAIRTRPSSESQVHYATPYTRELLDTVVARLPKEPIFLNVQGVIVPHHLLAARFIAQTFVRIATNSPMTIVLVSPDHFSQGLTNITVSEAEWDTPFGIIAPDRKLIKRLSQFSYIRIDERPFAKEHGISNEVTFIKYFFPNAKIVPIIVKDHADDIEVDKLAAVLSRDVLLVGSFDFSHGVTDRVADMQDEQSIVILKSRNLELSHEIKVDSRAGVRLLLKYFERLNDRFQLSAHSNAAKLLRQPVMTDVTSYIVGVFVH